MINLDVPYRSQRDNEYNPSGSCNVSSVAMCLLYYGVKPANPNEQLEDELYRYCLDHGLDRHSPHDLASLIKDYGHKDEFRSDARIKDIKDHLIAKKPCIIHGYFTSSGHIIVVKGFDERGFFVNDPWGEWWADGYDTKASGKNLHYSYALIKEACMPDGGCWVHFVGK